MEVKEDILVKLVFYLGPWIWSPELAGGEEGCGPGAGDGAPGASQCDVVITWSLILTPGGGAGAEAGVGRANGATVSLFPGAP